MEENHGILDEPAGTTKHTETPTSQCEIDHIFAPDPDTVQTFTRFCLETGLTSTWKQIHLLNFVLISLFSAELLVQSNLQMSPQGSCIS